MADDDGGVAATDDGAVGRLKRKPVSPVGTRAI
jgi:hypothetical protein